MACCDQVPGRVDLADAQFPDSTVGIVGGVIGVPAQAQAVDDFLHRCQACFRRDAHSKDVECIVMGLR